MNKFISLLVLFSFSFSSIAKEKNSNIMRIQGSKELPIELNLLLESYQNAAGREDHLTSKNLLPIIFNIDSYAKILSSENVFMVGKVEIYKTLLKTSSVFPRASINGDSLKNLQVAISNTSDPFILWFFRALLRDSRNLLETNLYKEYLLQKNNGVIEKREYKRIDKKVQLLYRWISKINTTSSDIQETFKSELQPILLECLKNIEQSYYLLALSSLGEAPLATNKKIEDLKFFSLKDEKKEEKEIKQDKTINEILDPLTDSQKEGPSPLPEPSLEDWTKEENTPQNLKNLPKPSNDADWLQDF